MKRSRIISAGLILVFAAVMAGVMAAHSTPARAADPTATITGVSFNGYNTMEFGYKNASGTNVKLADNSTTPSASYSVPYSARGALVLYLKDSTCNATYYSNGTGTADHAKIWGKKVAIMDGSAPCDASTTREPTSSGIHNLEATVSPANALDKGH